MGTVAFSWYNTRPLSISATSTARYGAATAAVTDIIHAKIVVKNPFISKNILVKKYGAGQQIKNTLKRFNVWYNKLHDRAAIGHTTGRCRKPMGSFCVMICLTARPPNSFVNSYIKRGA